MTRKSPKAEVLGKGQVREWTEVSLLIPDSCAEAISNFLIDEGTTGIEEIDADQGRKRLKAYFPAKERKGELLRRLYRYVKSLRDLYPELGRVQVETRSLAQENWGENWKRFFKPIEVTRHFLVSPPWSSLRPKKGQIPIIIHPGMAFGTGTHATTKLCLRALEEALKRKKRTVLDVGTGSGILAIAAAKAGAREVVAIDVDPVALEAARDNVRTNDAADRVRVRMGSVGKVLKEFDVVVANIDLKSLRRMRRPLFRHLKPGGILILSGILRRNEEDLRQFYLELEGLKPMKTTWEGEWSGLTFRKKLERPNRKSPVTLRSPGEGPLEAFSRGSS